MPHFDNNSLLVSRALVVHPPRRRKPTDTVKCIHGFESPSPILSKSLSEFLSLHFVLTWLGFDSRTRDPFYDIANGALSRTRLHDRFSGDPLYTSIALQPIVSAATTISHTNTQRPYQKDHSCVVQCCRARLHVVTLCASC